MINTNPRQIIRKYKREHYNLEVSRALRQLKNWIIKYDNIADAFTRVENSYGHEILSQVVYELSIRLNK